jgi:hypothetical protein
MNASLDRKSRLVEEEFTRDLVTPVLTFSAIWKTYTIAQRFPNYFSDTNSNHNELYYKDNCMVLRTALISF